jgi:hypothetical protein
LVALLRRDKMVELAKDANRSPALTTTTDRSVVLATPSYRERMKAQRAEARAKRDAEKAEWHRRAELRYEVRRLALDAVKAGIRARGDKLSLYSHAQLVAQANAMIGPCSSPRRSGRSLNETQNIRTKQKALCCKRSRCAKLMNEMERRNDRRLRSR